MNRRWLLLVVAMLLGHSLATAQTMMAPPMTGADPYAMSPTTSNPYWWGNGFSIPTSSCIQDRFWISADYLYWWTEGMDVPALVTSSSPGTSASDAGVLGLPTTSVLYGSGELNGGSANGLRARSGFWFRNGVWAIEGELFRIRNSTESYGVNGDGSPIIARPFFDIVSGDPSSRLISYPNVVTGGVSVSSDSELRSGLINLRRSLIPVGMLGCNDGCDPPDRVDWIVGYRVLELNDSLVISDSRNSLVTAANPDAIQSQDSFETKNQFQGLQLGVIYQAHFRRLWMESMMRVALGNNRQRATIQGATSITDNGTTNSYTGGLLAQRTNIGDFEQNEFAMIPELGLNLGIRITRCLHASIGYNVIYVANVLRAGDQVDLDVNSGLIPPEAVSVTGPLRPRFLAIEDNYWAHGLNFGAELRF